VRSQTAPAAAALDRQQTVVLITRLMAMRLRVCQAGGRKARAISIEVSGLYDSRKVALGEMFFAVAGEIRRP
jgi:hypothetical protein